MILNIIALLLIAAITFMHSIFGLFSGVLNLCCTLIAVVAAFGFFEPLTVVLNKQFEMHPAYTEPIVFILLFVITLSILRTAADNLIRGNVRVPPPVDTGGAIVLGFVNAQLCVGMLVIGILMLPIGGTVMGFTRLDRVQDGSDPDHSGLVRFERRSVWLWPDEFTIAVARAIGGGSMRGNAAITSVYPNFADAVFYSTNTVQWESTTAPYQDGKGDGTTAGLQVDKWWEQTEPVEARYRKEVPTKDEQRPKYEAHKFTPAPGMKLIGVRMTLRSAAADRRGGAAIHLFRPTMLRIVGDSAGQPFQAPARVIGGADSMLQGGLRVADPDNNFSMESPDAPIDAFFEVPTDFMPRFVEYRRRARAPLNTPKLDTAGKAPNLPALALLTPEEQQQQAQRSQGALSFLGFVEQPSGESWSLPLKLSVEKSRRSGAEVAFEGSENFLVSGRFQGFRNELEPALNDKVSERFALPEGFKVFQLRFKPKKAHSIAGKVFNYVSFTANQYFAVDNTAAKHNLCGYFAIVPRNGKEYIEFFFTPDPNSASFRHTLDFKEIKRAELENNDDAILGLLFVVPPGRSIIKVENQTGDGVSGFDYPIR